MNSELTRSRVILFMLDSLNKTLISERGASSKNKPEDIKALESFELMELKHEKREDMAAEIELGLHWI